jgi:hypothetical protein
MNTYSLISKFDMLIILYVSDGIPRALVIFLNKGLLFIQVKEVKLRVNQVMMHIPWLLENDTLLICHISALPDFY